MAVVLWVMSFAGLEMFEQQVFAVGALMEAAAVAILCQSGAAASLKRDLGKMGGQPTIIVVVSGLV